MATEMQDHPAWIATSVGVERVMLCRAVPWQLIWATSQPDVLDAIRLHRLDPHRHSADASDARPVIDQVALNDHCISEIATAVRTLGPVYRVRNSDLWDAIGTAIIRQVIRAAQARQMYLAFCQAHGATVTTEGTVHRLFPPPEQVVELSPADFAALRMTFKQPALVAAATAFLEHRHTWQQLDPAALVTALQAVPRIGPWTAGAAVADWSGDFSVYPYADLAVRTWARRAAPATV
jgi:DNA-3-methyladenine glycosylase II